MRWLRLGWLLVAVARPAFAQVPTEPAAPAPPAAHAPAAAPDSTGQTESYSLAWVRDDGAESCPTGRELARDVTLRLGRSPFDETAPRSIEIRVERTATGFR